MSSRMCSHRSVRPWRLAALAVGCLLPHLSALADNVRGAWSPVIPWPVIGVHAVLLPDGRIMSYGTRSTNFPANQAGQQTAFFDYDIWDPAGGLSGGHLTLPNDTATDIFCSSQLVLPTGDEVLINGGDNWTGTGTTNSGNRNSNTFSLAGNTLTRRNDMNRARWYSSAITLLNGETYIQGGSSGTDRPEVRQTNGSFRLLSGANTSSLDFMYARNFIAPDGRIFGFDSGGRMYYVNPAGTGSITMAGTFAASAVPGAPRGNSASAVMFRPGRILQLGGTNNGAVVIDIRGASPVLTATAPMPGPAARRELVNTAVMPDGRVLATGGSAVWNQLTDVTYTADIWDPLTGTWVQGAVADRARLYHSNSLLLPDGTVMIGGGGAPGPQKNLNVEVYYPPYLFDSGNQRVVQDTVSSIQGELQIGETFDVEMATTTPISRIAMIKTGSVTHSWNSEQRFNELVFVQRGSTLSVQAPTRAVDAPPGFYMLFAVNDAGIPAIAPILKVGVATDPNPSITPVLQNPGARTSARDVALTLALSATDPNNDVLGYGATGLPTGLSLNGITGQITGTPTQAGDFDVVVAASDGVNAATQSFLWRVEAFDELEVDPLPASGVVTSGGAVSFTATASNAINPRYRWNFGDGTPTTAWSSSPSASHTFSVPGVHYVTVTVTDDRGIEQTQVIAQMVRLAPAAVAGVTSSNIVFEPGAVGGPRLWVVNQDNDSVTVFNATTRARIAQIAVGAGPRGLAIAPNGHVWVTNKQDATISVISTASLAVVRTITLPLGSQPFGIAMAPGTNLAYVALEGSGQVVRYDVAGYTNVGSVAAGLHLRHVSISGDGGSIYASRFITPPVPGESTPTVSTSGGAEVLVIDATSMAVTRTISLAQSTLPDFENQGSGLPNYLGAVALSPDATQAWVPSKQDNIGRGTGRNGFPLDFQNTVRAISSRLDLATQLEVQGARIDHDNSSVASAAAYDPTGVYLFVALETSREVAVVDAHGGAEVFRFDAGRAPQGIVVSPDGQTLYVNNFMDRSVGAYDLGALIARGDLVAPLLGSLPTISTERLSPTVLVGKQLFYDARDARLARDAYMSCASCHNDGGQDGRVWDLTGFGEGLRNTVALRGRAAMDHGFLHWSGNFDELQDFEGQIRNLSGGTGLLSDAQFNAGTRSQPLGDAKAGLSSNLDALAAYVASLGTFAPSPYRSTGGALSAQGVAGRGVFESAGCAGCHQGERYTASGSANLVDVGTLKPSSGQRLGNNLTGIDTPTLRDVWATAPYLHDGSAATLADAVAAHSGVSIAGGDLANLVSFLRQLDGSEPSACPCDVFGGAIPGLLVANDGNAVELGVRFRSTASGFVTGVRFYKGGATNSGVHVGSLWSSTGTRLANATFTGETASGWQQVNFSSPVAVTAGTVYVASYYAPNGGYSADAGYFQAGAVQAGPLVLLGDAEAGGNGVYRYGAGGGFPNQSYNASNYYVDVLFRISVGPDTTPPVVTITSPTSAATHAAGSTPLALGGTATDNVGVTQVSWSNAATGASGTASGTGAWTVSGIALQAGSNAITVTARDAVGNTGTDVLTVSYAPDTTAPTITGRSPLSGAANVGVNAPVTVTFSEAMLASTINATTIELRDAGNLVVPAAITYNAATNTATLTPSAALAASSTYTATVRGGVAAPRVTDIAGNALAADSVWSFVTAAGPSCPCFVWDTPITPAIALANDSNAVELGVKFRATQSGYITGIRFYKGGAGNGGSHAGSLWSATGTLLARATFSGETGSGWQQATFATPIAVTANTVYVASYHAPQGRYSADGGYFASVGRSNGPLYLLRDGESGGNGVYVYSGSPSFPSQSYNASNYWVDVVFVP